MLNEIIYITESSGYGGAESYLITLVSAAKDIAKKVSVALPFKKQNERTRARLHALGIEVTELKQYRANYVLNLFLAWKFLRARKHAFLHFTLPYPDCCRWVLLVASLLRRKFIISELLVPKSPYRAGWYFCLSFLLFNRLKKLSYARAEKVIAICQSMKDTLVNAYGMPSSNISVVYNGIDKAAPELDAASKEKLQQELRVREKGLVVTSMGRLAGQKGHAYLLAAFEKLAAEFPSVTLLLVGEGPLRAILEAEVNRKGLAGHVVFTGFREDFRDILALTDVFVFPSLDEGFPFMIIEAMAAGNPIVATGVGGIPEAVIDNETGILVPPADAGVLVAAIRSLVKDAARRTEMGEKGRQRVSALFSKEKMVRETIALYGGAA
jgi:glycosyltransferase involved in cell wall biosynthesis